MRTNNGGSSWQVINANDLNGGYLNDIQMVNESVVFTVGLNGNVFRSGDGGTTFEEATAIIINGFTSINTSLYFMNDMEGWIGGDVSTDQASYVYYTEDGGATWEQQYLITRSPFHKLTDLTFAPDGTGWACGHQMGLDLNGEVILEGVVDTTTSIREPEIFLSDIVDFHISPNPLDKSSQIFFELASSGQVDITMVRSDGAIIKRVFRGHLHGGVHQFEIDGSTMTSGLYHCVLTHKGETRSFRVVVAR